MLRLKTDQDLRSDPHCHLGSAELLKLIGDSSRMYIAYVDAERHFRYVNRTYCDAFGKPRNEIIGQPVWEILGQNLYQSIKHHIDATLSAETCCHETLVEFPMLGKCWINASLVPHVAEDGKVCGYVVLANDVTDRREAEDKLRVGNAILSSQQEASFDGILVVNEKGKIISYNHRFVSMWNIPDRILSMQDDRAAIQYVLDQISDPDSFSERVNYLYQNPNETAWDEVRLRDGRLFDRYTAPMVDSCGKNYGRVWFFRDLTERQQAKATIEKLRHENIFLKESIGSDFNFGEMVGSSRGLKQTTWAIEKVAPTDSTVLLHGETGTGKELVARAIHKLSPRADKTLITVNCAAIPSGLMESEFFGHEKGAFTGALTRKTGRFEMAHESTIFLDEIGDLSLELQAKLLRVLQEGQLERVGGSETIQVNVRVVAATHRDLLAAVEQGEFRADLFYRLNVFPIEIPPLRDRREDIAPLARHFALKSASNMGKRIESIPKHAIRSLEQYNWPGNVRELQNLIERAVILSTGPELELGDWLRMGQPSSSPDPPRRTVNEDFMTLAEQERNHILAALDRSRWQISGQGGAANLLGLKPTTLHTRMNKLGIRRPS